MDRLRNAIEKAREQRSEAFKERPSAGPLKDVGFLPETAEEAPSREALWNSLKAVDANARAMKDLRLMSNQGGSQAVPYDLLRTRVLHQARQNGWRHIGIVSPTAACGKTTAAANLAFAFSHQPEVHMMLLDLDLRRPRLAGMMGQNVESGMEDVLLGRVDFADHARRLGNNVAIGFNNGASDRPSELLQSAQTEEWIAEVTERYDPDLVLIDLPPMMSTDDNFGFLSKVDAVLLMVAAEQSSNEQIDVAIRQLGELTTVMGLVLNKCRHTSSAYGYDDKYYYS